MLYRLVVIEGNGEDVLNIPIKYIEHSLESLYRARLVIKYANKRIKKPHEIIKDLTHPKSYYSKTGN